MRWFILLSAIFMAYLAGHNQGMNRGIDTTLQFDPKCRVY